MITPTYSHVVSTLALVVALSGSAYAAATITGANVKDGTLTGRDVKDSSITSPDVAGLTKKDFKAGTLLQGPPGADGADATLETLPVARAEVSTPSYTAMAGAPVVFNTEAYDTDDMVTAGSGFVTVPRTGLYEITGFYYWNSGGNSTRGIDLRTGGGMVTIEQTRETNTGAEFTQQLTTTKRLFAGDNLSMWVSSTGGSLQTADAMGQSDAWLSVTYLRG